MCLKKISIRTLLFFGIVLSSLFLWQSPLFVQDSSAASWTSSNFSSRINGATSQVDISFSSLDFDFSFKPVCVSLHLQNNSTSSTTSNGFWRVFPTEAKNSSSWIFGGLLPPPSVNNGVNNNLSLYNSGFNLLSCVTDVSLVDFSSTAVFRFSFTTSPFNIYWVNTTITLYDSLPSSGITPSGSFSITENGTYDVTNYAEAVVDVPTSSGGGSDDCDYHDDLVDIKNAIITGCAILLVIYFFYCIYRMLLRGRI